MNSQLFHKTGALIRFKLRQDRIRIPVWLISFLVANAAVAQAFSGLYVSEQEREAIAETMRNPAMIAMVGPGYGLDNYTDGAMMAHQMLLMTAVVVGIMSILLMARHTRAEEEDGRVEMVRALPAGRLSSLAAASTVLIITNVLLALLTGLGLYALGIESMDLEGSLLYGAALGAAGIFFTAVTALFSQLSENSRGVIGFSFAVLGISYLIRAVGDVSNEGLSWVSPLGWIVGTETYVNNYWWPILMTAAVSIAILVVAVTLNAIRDLGSGFLPSRPGRHNASILLQGPAGLGMRLQRTGFIAWGVGMVLLGASYGSVFGDLESFFSEIEMMAELFETEEGFTLTEQFLTMITSIIAIICSIPPLLAVLKLKGEEKKGRNEQVLSKSVSRSRLLGSYVIISVIIGFIMLSLASLALGLIGVSMMDNDMVVSTFYKAALVYLPAMWVMIGIAVLLVGILPQFTGFMWLYLVFSFVVVYMGGLFQFPEWVSTLTPYGHVSQLPVEELDFVSLAALTAAAVGALTAGFIGYNKRDLQG
ncbi:ABC transporter permease [Alteribacillus sp. HJP-4]|uniref:ABC transporter permease n=1 Tax=Alteribacillus sp. HJP-4 TaxID=2775394 RepID=UPI0035CCD98A